MSRTTTGNSDGNAPRACRDDIIKMSLPRKLRRWPIANGYQELTISFRRHSATI
jgi:hypothetical protein